MGLSRRGSRFWTYICALSLIFGGVRSFPEAGKWTLSLNSTNMYNGVVKNMFQGTKIYVRIQCSSSAQQKIRVGWVLRETKCWNEFAYLDRYALKAFSSYYETPEQTVDLGLSANASHVEYLRMEEEEHDCLETIELAGGSVHESKKDLDSNATGRPINLNKAGSAADAPLHTLEHEGVYLFVMHVKGSADSVFKAAVDLRMESPYGYLSVVDWPLLPFYGVMCGVYVCMGLGWLTVCAMHWRDLLRIQFWIGGVIFLGMMEKAVFYAEFQNINSTGMQTTGLILAAEIVSCAKRTLARMLVIIVSLGFGIVKPRLGPTLHRVLSIGGLYFVLASTEAYLRVMKPKNDVSTSMVMAEVPLAVVDSTICWWVFSGLAQTIRTLRLRRNLVKLSVYRRFTHVLIFSVVASLIFMLVNIKFFKMEECLREWRHLWIDEAFWHLQFSLLLLCIMVLWTPSKNNQRYAFTPLLDYDEDDYEDDPEPFDTSAYEGMKQRLNVMKNGKSSELRDGNVAHEEDPLKWVEENIPETAETSNPLPIIDSDDEIETTRFEISKMQ